MVYLILSQAHLNEVVLTKLGDHDTLQSHKPWFITTYCVEGPYEWDGNVIAISWEPGRVCLYTTLEGLCHTKFNFTFPWYTEITDRLRGIYSICPNLMKENRRMSTCKRLDLQTLGSQLIMPKNLPEHCSGASDSRPQVVLQSPGSPLPTCSRTPRTSNLWHSSPVGLLVHANVGLSCVKWC